MEPPDEQAKLARLMQISVLERVERRRPRRRRRRRGPLLLLVVAAALGFGAFVWGRELGDGARTVARAQPAPQRLTSRRHTEPRGQPTDPITAAPRAVGPALPLIDTR